MRATITVRRFPKRCVWRDPRIARLESLVAAINREIEHLKWLEQYCAPERREQPGRNHEARWMDLTR